MFCSSCGKNLSDGAKFCDGCGAAINGNASAAPAASVSAAPVSTVSVKSFRCDGCGAPMQIPTNAKGKVVCSSCGNECVIEGLVKNAEMAAKENINSGIALTAEPSIFHSCLVRLLSEVATAPLDVFENAEIVREERYCVPAYCFYCSGTASFTYEIAKWTTHKTAIDLGDRTRVEKEQIKDYTPMSGSSSVTATLFSSGNRELATQVNCLYLTCDSNKLVDYEYLEFPSDVQTFDSNFPQTASFNEQVKPSVERLIALDAEKSLSGKDYRDLSLGGCKVDKDEVIRVFLGVYRVVYTYNGEEYSLWFSGDGKEYWCDRLPIDPERQRVIAEKQQQLAAIPAAKGKTVPIILIVLGVLLSFCTWGLTLIMTVIGIVLLVVNAKKDKETEPLRIQAQEELNFVRSQYSNVVKEFKARKQPIKGIYAEVLENDASAF